MRHGQTVRNYAKAVFAFAALAIVSACSDKASAPSANVPAIKAPANFSQVGAEVVFRVNNAEGITQRIGNHIISIPANAICDLVTSGYGETYWNQDCTPLVGSVVITATIFEDSDGMPYVDFQPAMRFAPDKEVMLFLKQGMNTAKKELVVRWCNNLGACVDESLNDPTLKPFRVNRTPVIGRRLKHFSGYAVLGQDDCPGTAYYNGDGTWWCEDGDRGMSRRSGYMVASGEDVTDILNDKNKDDKKDDEK